MLCKNCRFWRKRAPGGMLHPLGSRQHLCTLRLYEYTDKETDEVHVVPSLNPNHEPGPLFGKPTAPKDTCSFVISKGQPTRKKHRPDKKRFRNGGNEKRVFPDNDSVG